MKHGKKYLEAAKAVDRSIQYDPADAISTVKKLATAKFDETIELHLRTGCDGRHAEQQIRGAVVLPHGTGKTVKVLVFAKGTKVDEAQAAGADRTVFKLLSDCNLETAFWISRGCSIVIKPFPARSLLCLSIFRCPSSSNTCMVAM